MDYRVYCNGKSYILPDFNVIKDNSQTFDLSTGVNLLIPPSAKCADTDLLIVDPITTSSPDISVHDAGGFPLSIFYDRGPNFECLQSGFNCIYDYMYAELFGSAMVGAVLKVYRFNDYRTGEWEGNFYEWVKWYNRVHGTNYTGNELVANERRASVFGELIAILRLDIIDAAGTLGWRVIPIDSLVYAGTTLPLRNDINIFISSFRTFIEDANQPRGIFYNLDNGWECIGFYFRGNQLLAQSKVGWFEINPQPGDRIEIFISQDGIYDCLINLGLPTNIITETSPDVMYQKLINYVGKPWKFNCGTSVDKYNGQGVKRWGITSVGDIIY